MNAWSGPLRARTSRLPGTCTLHVHLLGREPRTHRLQNSRYALPSVRVRPHKCVPSFASFDPLLSEPRTFMRRSFLALRRLVLQCELLAAVLVLPVAVHASPVSDALRELVQDDWIYRSVSLEDLGITAPTSLRMSESRQDYYLPVPRGIPLNDAVFKVEGQYAVGEVMPATFALSVNERPVLSQRIEDSTGVLDRHFDLDGVARESGFVHVQLEWNSPIARRVCEFDRITGNILTILPATSLSYRVRADASMTLDDAWRTLPGKPVMLVASGTLGKASYDSAWRIGVALARAGKSMQVRPLPAVGEVVDPRDLDVPAALAKVAAFAPWLKTSTHRIAHAAEIGAWLVAGGGGDLAVADTALTQQMNAALDALQLQFRDDAEAQAALAQWRAKHATLALKAPGNHQVQLTTLGRHAVIAIAPDAGARAAGLFDSAWRRVLTSSQATLHTVERPAQPDSVRLIDLGGSTQAFDVTTRGEWTVNVPLSAVTAAGYVPSRLLLDMAAAPGAAMSAPVASVTWNGVLIDAMRLTEHGQPEQLSARIPRYAVNVNNVLKVVFQRQPASPDCAEVVQGYPVNVLPSSYVELAHADPDGTFVGVLPSMTAASQVYVPKTWLDMSASTLPQLITMAAASAISPSHAELVLAEGEVRPSKPFLAMNVKVAGAEPVIEITDGNRLRVGAGAQPWLDIEGLGGLSAASVVAYEKQPGIVWYALGALPETLATPLVLSRGNGVVLGKNGPLVWADTESAADDRAAIQGGMFSEWRRYLSWTVPIVVGLFMVLVLLAFLARRARKKHESQ